MQRNLGRSSPPLGLCSAPPSLHQNRYRARQQLEKTKREVDEKADSRLLSAFPRSLIHSFTSAIICGY